MSLFLAGGKMTRATFFWRRAAHPHTFTSTFPNATLLIDDFLLCFAMQSSPPSNQSDRKILSELTSSEKDELRKSLLEPARDTSEHIGVHLPRINANHLFQIPNGPGLKRRRIGGR